MAWRWGGRTPRSSRRAPSSASAGVGARASAPGGDRARGRRKLRPRRRRAPQRRRRDARGGPAPGRRQARRAPSPRPCSTRMWDATLAVGHQVLSAADALPLAQKDLATATALLDLRPLAGDEALVTDLTSARGEGLFAEQELARVHRAARGRGRRRRHARYGGSVYLLEPDVKSGAGGLRDLDGIRWAARARYRVGETAGQQGGAARDLGEPGAARRDRRPRGPARSRRPRSTCGACATACTRARAARPTGSASRSRRRSPWPWATARTAREPPSV